MKLQELRDYRRTRVGDDDSPVMAGDPTPAGSVYRAGQYAPTVEELSNDTLLRAADAGLVSALPIYDGEGNVDQRKLDEWNPKLRGVHFDSDVPKYASAVTYDVLVGRPKLIEELGLTRVKAGDREEQAELTLVGEVIVKAEFVSRGGFTGRLVIYPSFYKYAMVPLVGKLPGRDAGLSVAAYCVLHALGHLKFAKMASEGKLTMISKILEFSGWSKEDTAAMEQANYFGLKNNQTSWLRKKNTKQSTEASQFSPSDDFAEVFAMYYTNREYLQQSFPEKFDVIAEIMGEDEDA